MKEMKTLKLPGQNEPYDIVDAYAREQLANKQDAKTSPISVSQGGTGLDSITAGNFLVGNGAEDMIEMSPEDVLSYINGASVMTLSTAEYEELETASATNANTLYMLTDAEEVDYVTETELESKGYLTEHQSLEGLATESYVDSKIAAIPTPDVSGQINTHNTATDAHNDIRLLIEGLTTRLNTLADSDDTTLDQMSEIVAYIKSNKTLIEEVTTNKVSVSDIIDNLTTNVSNKPLSAAQGVALKALIDAIVIPTKVSELANDKNYLTAVPAEYITETELNAKGYLTQHQSLEGLATESYVNTQVSSKQDAITGTAGQFVVIGSDGKPTTKTIAYAEEASF